MRTVYKPPWLFLPGLGLVTFITAFEGCAQPILPICAALAFFAATAVERVDHHRRNSEKGEPLDALPLLACALALLAGVLLLISHGVGRNGFHLAVGFLTTLFSAFYLLLGILTMVGKKKER